MACPNCGGSHRKLIAPGFYQCTSTWTLVEPTGLHPSGIFGPTERTVTNVCGHEYQEGTGVAGQDVCDEHALYAIGVCALCRDEPVCGRCPGQFCLTCRVEAKRKADESSAEQRAQADKNAAALATQRAREKAAQLERHAQRKAANIAQQKRSQESLTAEVNRLRARAPMYEPYRARGRPGMTILAIIAAQLPSTLLFDPGSGRWIVGWIGFSLLGFLIVHVDGIWKVIAVRHNQRRRERQAELIRGIGCGTSGCSECHANLVRPWTKPPHNYYIKT